LQQETLPWYHFVHELDLISDSEVTSGSMHKPSARAIALTDHSRGCPEDILLRAYKMDHALLSTSVSLLKKEMERYDALVKAQEFSSEFLTDYNVWSIVNSSEQQQGNSITVSEARDLTTEPDHKA
jgi:hypothetical protein